MSKVLAAWLPLLVGALLLLRGCAALIGPNPHSVLGEMHVLEKFMHSKKRKAAFVLIVAVGMSLMLALLALAITILYNLKLERWMLYCMYVILAVGGVLFVGMQAVLIARLFRTKPAKTLAVLAVVTIGVTWFMWPNWLTVDLFALVAIVGVLSAYLQWTLNFQIVALAGAGMFLYDVVNVYFTGNMMRVAEPAMQAGIPGMIVVPASLSFDAQPVSGLGTGDIIFPGFMIMLAAVLSYRTRNKTVLYGGLAGYAVGLVLVFGILYFAHHAQPALVTLYPCVLAGILLAARQTHQLQALFSMRHVKKGHLHGRDCACDCQPA